MIMGSSLGWLIWGVITGDYSTSGFSTFLTGIILGFLIGRRNPKEDTA